MEWISGFKIFFPVWKTTPWEGCSSWVVAPILPELHSHPRNCRCWPSIFLSKKYVLEMYDESNTEKPWGKPGFSPSSALASCVTDSRQGASSFWVPQKHGRITVSHSEVSASTGWTNACQTFSHVVYAKTFSELMSPRSFFMKFLLPVFFVYVYVYVW